MGFPLARALFRALLLAFVATSSGDAKEFRVATVEEAHNAIAEAEPGDAIVLRNGVWRDADILFDAEGTAAAPITLRADAPGGAIFQGATRFRIGGRHLVVSGLHFREAYNDDHLIAFRRNSKQLAEDCRLTDCAIIDCNHPRDTGESRWITFYGRRNRIDHCTIEGKTTKGTTLVAFIEEEPNRHRIDHNYFGRREKLGENGGETIRIGDSGTSQFSSQTIVEHNLFEQCNGEVEIISNKSCDNVYRHNTFLRCSGALTLRHGHRALVEGNYFLGQRAGGTGGVRVIGSGHRIINNYFSDTEGDDSRAALSLMNGLADSPADGYEPVTDVVVAFNTFVNCKESIVVGLAEDEEPDVPPANCAIANNLVVPRHDRKAVFIRTAPKSLRWAGNLVQGEIGAAIRGVREVDDLRLEEDGFVRRLTATSPAIDAAAPGFDEVTQDIAGRERREPKDIGCEEYSRAPGPIAPITRESAGIQWPIELGL